MDSFHMLGQITFIGKSLVAYSTSERLLTGMRSHMAVQLMLLSEAAGGMDRDETHLTGMRSHMPV